MNDLKALYESLGFTTVQTLLQSGNVVFFCENLDLSDIKETIEAAIEAKFGFNSELFVYSLQQFEAAYNNNPFTTESNLEPSKVLVFFFLAKPSESVIESLLQAHEGPEQLIVKGQVLYIYFPNGMGRSVLADKLLPKFIKISNTARNWNTMTKILTLAKST